MVPLLNPPAQQPRAVAAHDAVAGAERQPDGTAREAIRRGSYRMVNSKVTV